MNMKKTLLATALVAASSAALALPNIEVLATGGTIAGAGHRQHHAEASRSNRFSRHDRRRLVEARQDDQPRL